MRPEILFALFAPSSSLKGVGPRLAPLLDKLAGPRVRDVLFLTPQRIVRRTPARVADANEDAAQIFALVIDNYIAPVLGSMPLRSVRAEHLDRLYGALHDRTKRFGDRG